ncbi:hypothetical protein N6H14_24725 [Paenibacillus sp. CC-CFT747]|nr:hypothetical protein N6H14_24725 [Paenibacillus sp. CC-CFT747]
MTYAWIYIVLLGLLLLVVSRFAPKPSEPSASLLKDMEETMGSFAAELEEENRELLETIAVMNKEQEKRMARLEARIDQLEKHSHALSQELKSVRLKAQSSPPPAAMPVKAEERVREEPLPSSQPEPPATDLKSRYGELFGFYAEGKSVEQIAKKLGMNKGEVQLILQLAKQEEANRA